MNTASNCNAQCLLWPKIKTFTRKLPNFTDILLLFWPLTKIYNHSDHETIFRWNYTQLPSRRRVTQPVTTYDLKDMIFWKSKKSENTSQPPVGGLRKSEPPRLVFQPPVERDASPFLLGFDLFLLCTTHTTSVLHQTFQNSLC